ncbi:hypothetical protein L2750_13880 [Shewanella submarina]|uniref:Delta-class carbonic anhydrase n=1 Tax=Shewanella submarina TaxID=2016376 RepID=A0ABV7GHT7_9GAMM|nr:delta-class carbonic anhydrase [Shewanella submarina]MCL1038233.1 hypothetical protein [Shewanella submarina]
MILCGAVSTGSVAGVLSTHDNQDAVADLVISKQRMTLANNTDGKGYGPQSPRNIDATAGNNHLQFNASPDRTQMNLCNIHFHKNAEHQGGEFNQYAGNGDGHGYNSGYKYSGKLSKAELKPVKEMKCTTEHGCVGPGDTIEVHYVYSTAKVAPGPTLGSCLNEAVNNPQLRVEAQVFVLVNDHSAADFVKLTEVSKQGGFYQAQNIPTDTGKPIQYAGSTTGPKYNEKGSPFQVTWSVRPKVEKVDVSTVQQWLDNNQFDEDHAHGVRNLVKNPDLLSSIQ